MISIIPQKDNPNPNNKIIAYLVVSGKKIKQIPKIKQIILNINEVILIFLKKFFIQVPL